MICVLWNYLGQTCKESIQLRVRHGRHYNMAWFSVLSQMCRSHKGIACNCGYGNNNYDENDDDNDINTIEKRK